MSYSQDPYRRNYVAQLQTDQYRDQQQNQYADSYNQQYSAAPNVPQQRYQQDANTHRQPEQRRVRQGNHAQQVPHYDNGYGRDDGYSRQNGYWEEPSQQQAHQQANGYNAASPPPQGQGRTYQYDERYQGRSNGNSRQGHRPQVNGEAHRGPNAANAQPANPELRQQTKRESNRIVDRIVELVYRRYKLIHVYRTRAHTTEAAFTRDSGLGQSIPYLQPKEEGAEGQTLQS